MTEKEAGAQPLLYSELDVNDLFCNSERKMIQYISSFVEKESYQPFWKDIFSFLVISIKFLAGNLQLGTITLLLLLLLLFTADRLFVQADPQCFEFSFRLWRLDFYFQFILL